MMSISLSVDKSPVSNATRNHQNRQKRSETVYLITSLKPDKASPEKLLKINREHWGIENKSHYVRDVTYDEDRSQIRSKNGPRMMAILRNLVCYAWQSMTILPLPLGRWRQNLIRRCD